jgi:hypothetical protein
VVHLAHLRQQSRLLGTPRFCRWFYRAAVAQTSFKFSTAEVIIAAIRS